MPYTQRDGQRLYEEDRARAFADPRFRAVYRREAFKKRVWLWLAETWQHVRSLLRR